MRLALLVVVLVLAVVTARLVIAARSAPRPVTVPSPELRATARTTGRWRLAGAAVGLAVGVITAHQGALGRGLLLAAPLLALCVLAGVLVGELRVHRPQGPVRSAVLEVRRVRDYVPRTLGASVGAATALLALVVALTTAAGSADDLGRAGRTLARQCSAVSSEGAGPWPGSFYTLPLIVVVACGLVAAGLAVTRVVRRPRQGGDVGGDDALRRSAVEAVTAAVGLLVAVPLAGVSATAGMIMIGFGCRPGWWNVPSVALVVLVPAAIALAGWCAAILAWPAPAVSPTEPARR